MRIFAPPPNFLLFLFFGIAHKLFLIGPQSGFQEGIFSPLRMRNQRKGKFQEGIFGPPLLPIGMHFQKLSKNFDTKLFRRMRNKKRQFLKEDPPLLFLLFIFLFLQK